jgi:eukaryotic-like serine/threonine-protein kinase
MRQEPRPGDIVAGKYRVRAILGRGRGTLVEAENVSFEQRVAIRIVSPQLGDNVEIGKFRREARALAKLGSEHVARIIDVGNLQDGSFYLVRQYLEGLDVARYLKGRRTLGVEESIGWILQATEAVAETHAYGILLRELSPSHLFLADRSPGVRSGPRVLKVIDFGTSKLLRENSDAAVEEFTSTTLTGISPYSSPEMLRRQKDLDVRTDVWSLGAILYEMLSGRPPFGSDTLSLAIAITRDNPTPLGQLRRDVPPEVEEAVMRSLSKDRNQRTADTHAFAASLARFAPPEGRASAKPRSS